MNPVLSLEGNLPGTENMARDAALLDALKGQAWAARVYGWDGPWITLGMFQNPERDLLPGSGVPWVMRPTGGRAVLHGHDVTLGLAVRLDAIAQPEESIEVLARSVRTVYRRTVRPIVRAIRACGVEAVLGEELKGAGPVSRSSDCFAHLSANDVVNPRTLKKVCGVAMRLTDEAVLIQASLPAGPPLVDPGLVYADPAGVAWSAIGMAEFAAALELELNALTPNP